MYHQDWLMRKIETIIQMVAKIIFKKDFERDNIQFDIYDESNSVEIHRLYERLIDLINELKINEAENILFVEINNDDLIYIKIAVDFYNRLNKLNDEELERANFTREEIKSGLEDILKLYNISLTI
ncbi:hypothetical protein KQH90_00665 [Anaerosalibacter bizertensis]|uniref:DUF6483 family protein n=1 Tax=Anaerosalibacter bizertensis TaxID=932217 RepID=UPI001771704F|nr:DUF6483 family protein [Anaerosalibacter bizertensis]MBU5292543.1 hypothetical protein [Anaerosalibacter bizertensis]HHV26894.1 hypothetical protein [Tissierellia bacterium]